ncbi:MAG: hypothetical protein E6I84_07805 [Chloroflexi bacterium]|nr:MAG: hypothetical protein E6J32_03090 [Chloroflexota bacterium]TMD65937.1 MAG: hypothetical protein E6I84_07805 [Chloroflexota bacterium]
MRLGSLVLGVIGLLVGAVWILQGVGVLPGSFMSGQRLWLVIGVIVAVIGLALTYRGLRRPAGS